ncbi:hypothetical protein VF21_05692 [Pseudogymnoascus sp. 05NY08]|nr:hypothetical protein VF21_05692 [Pseudogymnoascus sp. 05NY08]
MRPPPTLALLAAATTAAVVEAQQGAYSQCGGTAWAGPTTCKGKRADPIYSEWFYQCLPSSFPGPTPTLSDTTAPASTPTTATSTPLPPAATLTPNNLWIRAVEEPNYHAYLQSSSSGVAVLGSASSAAQFIFNGGRIILLDASTALRALVHPEVIGAENGTAGRLAVTFVEWGSGEADYGGFLYKGDTLMWRNLGLAVPRPDESAWLVCGGGEVFVNLGAAGEGTPEGCVDQTVSFWE